MSTENATEQPTQDGATRPVKARRTRRRLPTSRELLMKLWRAIETAEELLAHHDPATRLRAIHALGTVGGAYSRTLETGELEGRVRALEAALKAEEGRP